MNDVEDTAERADGATKTDDDPALTRHRAAFKPVSDCPIRSGNAATLLPDAMSTLRAMWNSMRAAQHAILLEFYTLENIIVDGVALLDLLLERRAAGVAIAVIHDAIGSDNTADDVWTRMRGAGIATLTFRATNPLRRTFSLRVNDRDHRKILVVDDRVAFLGGVNIDRQYLNPPGSPIRDGRTDRAYWIDAAARFDGPVAADAARLFRHTWRRHGGADGVLPPDGPLPDAAPGGAAVCVEGSAPREGRPLHVRALLAALAAAERRVFIASGYFVPTEAEIHAMVETAERGVDVRLVLPGVSDVPMVVNAARASYGRLLRAGIRIHERRDAVLHAKVSTADGVWTSIGSSNLDVRSAVLNNEADAVVLDRGFAATVERTMGSWFASGVDIRLADWRRRSWRERALEAGAFGWKRLM